MKQYAWRSGFPIPPIAADVFGQIKERIEAENGVVRPADIVAEAGRPGSPLRPALEWDDAKAADAHRIDQARRLLGALQVVRVQIEHSPAVSSKAMFRVRPDHGPAGYVSQDKIIGDRELRKQVIGSARKELESFVGKYAGVLAMGTFIPRLQDVINEMLDEIERLEVDASRRQTKARSSEEPLAYREAAQ